MSRRRISWIAVLLWAVPALAVFSLVGFFVAKHLIDSYLRSEYFRSFLAQKAGHTLRAEASLAPLHFDTASIYTDAFAAQGGAPAIFSKLQLDGLRAELSWRRFFEHVWQVDQVDVQRLRVQLDGPRVLLPPEALVEPRSPTTGKRSRWLPDRVEISNVTIREAQLDWAGGKLRGAGVQAQPADGGWNIDAAGGAIEHGTLPPLDLLHCTLRYSAPSIFVKSAEFRQGAQGSITMTGEINTKERLDLHADFRGLSIAPLLPEDWRLRFVGDVAGEVRILSPLPVQGPPQLSGKLTLANGHLEALPVLDQIAAFTRTQQFRKIQLSRATCDFVQNGGTTTVTNLVTESEGLIRVEGAFTVVNSQIDGSFSVGVTRASLQWLPGSQTKVFTEERAGYLWAPMRLTGPVNAPKEDLSGRLAAAAGLTLIEGVQGTLQEGSKTLKDATQGALDLLFPKTK